MCKETSDRIIDIKTKLIGGTDRRRLRVGDAYLYNT
jgi:hypothetical protein